MHFEMKEVKNYCLNEFSYNTDDLGWKIQSKSQTALLPYNFVLLAVF